MIEMTRLEIVIDAAHTPQMIEALRDAGAPGYTLVRDVQGSGDRGDRGGDGLGNVFRNCYIVVAVAHEQADALIQAAHPLLQKHGGICLKSQAQWVEH